MPALSAGAVRKRETELRLVATVVGFAPAGGLRSERCDGAARGGSRWAEDGSCWYAVSVREPLRTVVHHRPFGPRF